MPLKDPGPLTAEQKMERRIRILWITFVSSLVFFVLLITGINYGLVGYMPSVGELENPQSAISSEIFAADGTLLGRYYVTDRSNSIFSEISPNIISALIAREDYRFYEHSGIDAVATAAIPLYMLIHKKRGSSTITQQLAKNLFPRKSENFFTLPFMKLKEWVLAVKLERNLTKKEIITLYLNTVPFSDNVYGIKNASQTFFNKTPDKVTIDEAAVLIAQLKGNTLYNPRSHSAKAKEQRNVVLDQMHKYGYINDAQLTELRGKETPLDYHRIDYNTGLAPYFRQIVEQQVKLQCKGLKKPDGTPYDIYKDGLKIYTTLDMHMQRYAEEAVQEHLTDLQKQFMAQSGYNDGSVWKRGSALNILNASIKASDRYKGMMDDEIPEVKAMELMKKPVKMRLFAWNKARYKDTVMSPIDSIKYMKLFLQSGFMAMDPFTGEVKAWVGGIDHKSFQYDHVNINTKRQVGSTIKPLLYCFALEKGFSPCGIVSTAPQEFPGMKKPYDANMKGTTPEDMSLSRALALSINNAALYVLKQVGMEAFVDFAHKCGITAHMDPYPSVALGVSDISLYEMLGAYSMFPAGGIHTEPFFLSKIEDKNGVLIKSFAPSQKEIVNRNTAFKMVKMMRGVVNAGTGGRLRFKYGIHNDIAGKTGTTNSQADAWFIGYTPQLIAGVWVGCDDRVFRFRSERLGQGASAALPIWAYFMKRVYADRTTGINPAKTFDQPGDFADCQTMDTTGFYFDKTKKDSTEVDEDAGPPVQDINE